jgi:hypothetical protein
MMNCFEARQDFVGFWQSALDSERCRELVAHLKGCAKCDRAFRAFALTAPMLHAAGAAADKTGITARQDNPRIAPHAAQNGSQSFRIDAPVDMNRVRRADAGRAAEILRHASVYRLADRRPSHQWRNVTAGLSAAAAAVLLAYFSVAAPAQSFDEALANSDAISETVSQPDTDFLGQQIPSMPVVNNDLAG